MSTSTYQGYQSKYTTSYDYKRATSPTNQTSQLKPQSPNNSTQNPKATLTFNATAGMNATTNGATSYTQGTRYTPSYKAETSPRTQVPTNGSGGATGTYASYQPQYGNKVTSPKNESGIKMTTIQYQSGVHSHNSSGTVSSQLSPDPTERPRAQQFQNGLGKSNTDAIFNNLNKYFGSSSNQNEFKVTYTTSDKLQMTTPTTGLRTETEQSPDKLAGITPTLIMTTTPEKIKTGIRAIDLMKSNEKIQKLKVIPDTVLDQQYLQVSRATDPTSKLKLSGFTLKDSNVLKVSPRSTNRRSPEPTQHASPDSLRRVTSNSNLVDANTSKFERGALFQRRVEYESTQFEPANTTTQPVNLKLSQSGVNLLTSQVLGRQTSPLRSGYCSPRNECEPSKKFSIPSVDYMAYQLVEETYADGTRYEGEKLLGKKHGRGRYYFKEGYIYDGEWSDGTMSGYGQLWHDDKRKIYEGEWEKGVFHGQGTMFNNELNKLVEFDGSDFCKLKGGWLKFEGTFAKGMKKGMGTLLLANGDVFFGHFLNDVVHGRGSYTNKRGSTYAGLWEVNKLVDRC